jgi:hypothetical protein
MTRYRNTTLNRRTRATIEIARLVDAIKQEEADDSYG